HFRGASTVHHQRDGWREGEGMLYRTVEEEQFPPLQRHGGLHHRTLASRSLGTKAGDVVDGRAGEKWQIEIHRRFGRALEHQEGGDGHWSYRLSYTPSYRRHTSQKAGGILPSALSCRMARWLCQPPDTSTAYLRSGILRWVRVRRTLLSFGSPSWVRRNSTSERSRPSGPKVKTRRCGFWRARRMFSEVWPVLSISMNFSGGGAWLGDRVLCLKRMVKGWPTFSGRSPEANHSPRFLSSAMKSQMRSIGPGRIRTNSTVCGSGRVAKSSMVHLFKPLRSTP